MRFKLQGMSVLLLLSLPLLLPGCRESESKRIERLEQALKTDQKAAAKEEIEKELARLSTGESRKIEEPGFRSLRRSLSGSSVFWIQENRLKFLNPDRESITLSGAPYEFRTSPSGNFAAVLFKRESDCALRIYSIEDRKALGDEIPALCFPAFTVSDDGRSIYYTEDKWIKKSTFDEDHENLHTENFTEIKNFAPRFARSTNRFELYAAADNSLLVFFGAAGYYRLYSVLKNTAPRMLDQGFSRPTLYGLLKTDPLAQNQTAEDPKIFAQALWGGTGQYKIRPISLAPVVSIGAGRPIPSTTNTACVNSSQDCYILKNGLLARVKESGRTETLPLLALSFEIFQSGILFQTKDGLYLREGSFSDYEMNLVRLHESAF